MGKRAEGSKRKKKALVRALIMLIFTPHIVIIVLMQNVMIDSLNVEVLQSQ